MSDRRLQTTGKLALVFPGQGTQQVGMARDIYASQPAARRLFDEADATLGFPLSKLCFEGPEAELGDTPNSQPAILTASAALLAVCKARFGDQLAPSFVAGHSLGEFSAYVAAGVLGFAESIRLVRRRGELMKQAGEQNPGAMAAILGLDPEVLRVVCTESGDVWLANDNCPGQTVVSGARASLGHALKLAGEKGARRVVPLTVSIPGHCPLMAPAATSLADYIHDLPFQRARVPVIANVTGLPIVEPDQVRAEIIAHLTSGVQWVDSVRYMIAEGVRTFIEIGPKSVLCGLIRQIDRTVQTVNVSTLANLEALGV